MSINQETLDLLREVFPLEAHEHVQGAGGRYYTYLGELALTERLNSIDPDWTFVIDGQMVHIPEHGPGVVSVRATLTVCGVARSDIGTDEARVKNSVWATEDGKRVKKRLTTPEIMPVNENTFKAAATDALKRCCRKFGVGWYLISQAFKQKMKGAKSEAEADRRLAQWHAWFTGETPTAVPASAPSPAPTSDYDPLSDDRKVDQASIKDLYGWIRSTFDIDNDGHAANVVLEATDCAGDWPAFYASEFQVRAVADRVVKNREAKA